MLNFSIEENFLKEIGNSSLALAGVDEAGRGALAGPVVAASVIILNLPVNDEITEKIDDSKKLSKKKREEIYELLCKSEAIIGVGIVDNNIIDKVNILNATFIAMEKSLESLKTKAEAVMIDGNKIPKKIKVPAISVVKGDAKSLSIAAASIIAKVTRDRIMDTLAMEYQEYSWNINKGYGTKAHYDAIAEYGITPYHRKSFRLSRQSTPSDSQSLLLFPNLLK